MRADLGSRDWAVLAFKSRAVSGGVTKHLFLFLIKHGIRKDNVAVRVFRQLVYKCCKYTRVSPNNCLICTLH